MRLAVVPLVLLLGACEGSFFSVGDRWHTPRIGEAYSARDACLAKSAANEASAVDPTAAAHDVARACASETEKLVTITNRDGDSKVAGNIRDDSEFRAISYVMRARGQAAMATAKAPPVSPAPAYMAEDSGRHTPGLTP
jgi:hypothetical protein